MSNKITPLIRRIPQKGGSFYTFPSSAEDLTLSMMENNYNFRFSKFALINIPRVTTNAGGNNAMNLKVIPGAYDYVDFARTTDWNTHFIESFQNYCLNLETLLLSKDTYNQNLYGTVSERVFFKWLKELTAVRFQEAVFSGTSPNDNYARFLEENDSSLYDRVVKYIGEIDFINVVKDSSNSYVEVLVNVPTDLGSTNDVIFKIVSDENYDSQMIIENNPTDIKNVEYLSGRAYNDFHPDGLILNAFYDNDFQIGTTNQSGVSYRFYKMAIDGTYTENSWWYPITSSTNQYYTDSEFTNWGNDKLKIEKISGNSSQSLEFIRSRADGICIDFDVSSYQQFKGDTTLNSLKDLSKEIDSTDYEFNAILVYYDLYTKDTTGTVYTENVLATNLFGVLFLDNLETDSLGGAIIPSYQKCIPVPELNINGNSYSFKINLKMNTSIDNALVVEHYVSQDSAVSMELFSQALDEMRSTSNVVVNNDLRMLALASRMNLLEKYSKFYTSENLIAVANRMKKLEDDFISFSGRETTISNSDSLDRINKTINDLLSNKTQAASFVDLNTFIPGFGIDFQKTSDSRLVMSSNNVNYNYNTKNNSLLYLDEFIFNTLPDGITTWNNTADLLPGNNYYRIVTKTYNNYNKPIVINGVPKSKYAVSESSMTIDKLAPEPWAIIINDSLTQWKKGQVFRLAFGVNWQLSSPGNGLDSTIPFKIYTGYNTDYKSGLIEYNCLIILDQDIFKTRNYRPIVDVHCVDPQTMKFFVDVVN